MDKSQHRNTKVMKKQSSNMTTPKVNTSSITKSKGIKMFAILG
jgi:hypothetical protein